MLGLFKKKATPINFVAASVATLPEIVPAAGDILPCEQVFTDTFTPDNVDRSFITSVAAALQIAPKYVPWNSLTPKRTGYLNIQYPVYDLLDPFFVHGPEGARGSALRQLEDLRRDRLSLVIGSGCLLGVCSDDVLIRSSLGRWESKGTRESHKAWMSAPTQHLFALYCTLPGFIPPAYRSKIIAARDVAKQVGGECRLIIEANWKLAGTAPGKPDKADPIIVIRKGENLAYIDRFDCTAKEEHLAREHAVKLP